MRSHQTRSELTDCESVTEWSNSQRFYTCRIDEGGPPFAKTIAITFAVKEQDSKTLVSKVIDLKPKPLFIILTPLFNVLLPKKLGRFLGGITGIKV